MKIFALTVGALVLAVPVVLSVQKKSQEAAPVAWGVLSGNSGCVIFAEGHKTKGRFYGIAVTTKTVGKLTVVET